MTSIVRIALPVPLHTLFDYETADETAAPGCRVLVPFGRRRLVGIVVEHRTTSELNECRLRHVERVLDQVPILDAELMTTLRWAARYYQHPLGEVIEAALPVALRSARPLPESGIPALKLSSAGIIARANPKQRYGARTEALLAELVDGALSTGQLADLDPDRGSTVRAALRRGWIERVRVKSPSAVHRGTVGPALNAEQRHAAEAVKAAGDAFAAFLLNGVTGSGKTEVYLDIITSCLERGRQALVLVPEIALTPQTLKRFRLRLGVDIAVLHSGLGEADRARAWLAAARGEARVVLGTRSAVFVPLPDPGVIIIDEEHDTSYKQQDGFRYHARDLAVVRAKALAVPVVLASATPSLESLANAAENRYRELRLRHRAGPARPPAVHVTDLRHQHLHDGLAMSTLDAISQCLERGEQVLVFRNRRGYAPILICHECGWSAQCPHCDRALTLHRGEQRLRCHHCGFEMKMPPACPHCQGLVLNPLGQGTERLDQALSARFPGIPVLRIDRDTTRGRRARDALFASLPDSGARILVGTQMLAKGHDLPHLTLVVIAGVDEGLYSVDFRAAERLGQLLVQVAGRAGRAERAGTVILQTHDPQNPLLATLLHGGYSALVSELLKDRRAACLPPFVQYALLRAEASNKDILDTFLRATAAAVRGSAVVMHGPMAAPMARRAGSFRGQVLIEAAERAALQRFLPGWLAALRKLPRVQAVRWSIDVDPVDLY